MVRFPLKKCKIVLKPVELATDFYIVSKKIRKIRIVFENCQVMRQFLFATKNGKLVILHAITEGDKKTTEKNTSWASSASDSVLMVNISPVRCYNW